MTDHLLDAYKNQMNSLGGGTTGLDEKRHAALTGFAELGFPGKKNEAWRYANISGLRRNVYSLAGTGDKTAPEIEGEFACRLVYNNGIFNDAQSFRSSEMDEARIAHLSNLPAENAGHADEFSVDGDGVALLNAALAREGYVLNIPAGVKVEKPILIHHVVSDADMAAVHVRHCIEMGEGAEATIIESFSGDNSAYWLNNITRAKVSQGATLTHLRLLNDGDTATNTSKCYVDLGACAAYKSFTVTAGGQMERSESHVRLLGEKSFAQLDCVALAASGQTHDVVTQVEHAVPNAVSDQMFRAVLAKAGKTAFQGKITVQKDAQHTQADQTCNSMLLDRGADANAKPELEIWADDVKCSHGATVGELDDDALFYLMSRGIEPDEARALLVEAFVAQVVDRLESDALKEIAASYIEKWLDAHLRRKA